MKTVSALFNKTFTPETSTKFFNFYEANGKSLSALADGLIGSPSYEALYAGAGTVSEFGKILMAKYGMTYGGTSDADKKMTDFVNYSFEHAADNNSLRTIQAVDKYIVATLLPSITAGNVFETMNKAIENKATVATAFKNNAENAGKEMSLSSVTSDPATVTAANAGATATAGTTYTLTTGIDALTGTNGNDTFVADAATTSGADQVNGGAGTDTLKIYGATTVAPTFTNIENVELFGRNATAFDTTSNADVKSVTVNGAITGASTITVAAGQSVALMNSAIGANIATTATNTTMAVTLDKLSAGTVDFDGAALATVDLTVAGKSAVILTNNEKLVTLNISGAGEATLTTTGAALTTVNAATATGNVSITLAATDTTVTGGTGNDTANFVAGFTKADKFNGGEGKDTLEITQASLATVQGYTTAADIAAVKANITSVEVLKITDAITGSIDASRFNNVNEIVLDGGNGTGTSTISKVTSGVTVTMNDAAALTSTILAVDIIDATLAGNNSDVLNIVLNDVAGGAKSDVGVINAVGVDILNIDTKSVTATGTAGTTVSYELDIAATSTALDKLVVTGNIGLDLLTGTALLTKSIAEVDASGMTIAKVTDAGIKVGIETGGTNGVKMTGSDGVDTLEGGDAADIIIAGKGADTITGGKGNDKLTGGEGSDTFKFGASFAANGKDTITDFKAGAILDGGDKLDFSAVFGGASTVTTATLAISSGSANQAISNGSVYQITLNSDIATKDFSDADFASLFGAASGQFSTTVTASDKAVILVKGNDTTHAYSVENSAADTTIVAAEVNLIGVIAVDGALIADNIA